MFPCCNNLIDLDYGIIPDVITLPGIPIGLAASLVLPSISIFNALLGILAGGGTLFMVAWIYSLITGKEGMGGGDIKLLAMLGPFLGWKGVFFTIFAASVVGMLAGIIEMIRHREGMKLAIPFGPFISIGAILYIFYGPGLMTMVLEFYQSRMRPNPPSLSSRAQFISFHRTLSTRLALTYSNGFKIITVPETDPSKGQVHFFASYFSLRSGH